jgi:CHAT domain-containing protein
MTVERRGGGGWVSPGGLFQLGAGLVVGTAWKVHDADALAILSALYRAVSRGESWEQAVVAAMRGLRDGLGDDAVERWSPFLTMVG